MAERSFSVQAAETLERLLEQMEALPALDDTDMDIVDGVLTLEFEDGTQIILNRQEPLQQIWLASPLGPAHFSYDAASDRWLDDRTGESLGEVLGRALSQKTGQALRLD
ncbi:iron donor protein CyaY [Thiohalobacter sp. IOR34]|uniref:iron donor protein CyaY n=1 Tax=Thiohalobacter sp. IOR34 TaxID=3057176 RepID=UPI0025B08BE0|nr:iron donor protein CyaY [Thiohalobacter sp. IOR34]WJW75995.1 iron donor protein CyaY [Thiohalobacter sp. IOR34]